MIMTGHSRRHAGFTLLEILVVVLIITILATIVGINVVNSPGQARVTVAQAQLQTLRNALQLYKAQQGRYPTQRQGLQALVSPADTEPVPRQFPEGGYLATPAVPDDPWGNPFVYLIPGSSGEPFEVITYGADAEPGGDGEDGDLSSSSL